MARLLAIDYGLKRTGIAVTDSLQLIAQPLTTVATQQLFNFLESYFQHEEVEKVVVGEPHKMNNTDSETMPYIRQMVSDFQKRFPQIPITLYDERFTSVLAHRSMIEGGMKRKKRQDKAVVDKIAACIILEDYLTQIGH